MLGSRLTIDENSGDADGWDESEEAEEVVEMLAETRLSAFGGLLCRYADSQDDEKDSQDGKSDTSGEARGNVDVCVTHLGGGIARDLEEVTEDTLTNERTRKYDMLERETDGSP